MFLKTVQSGGGSGIPTNFAYQSENTGGIYGLEIGKTYCICYVRLGLADTGNPSSGNVIFNKKTSSIAGGSTVGIWIGIVKATASDIVFSGTGNMAYAIKID